MSNTEEYVSQKKLREIVGGTLQRVQTAVSAAGITPVIKGRSHCIRVSDIERVQEFLCIDLQPEFVDIDLESKAWLAGFFDAEGSVSISVESRQKGYTAHWDIGNTDKKMMDRVSSILQEAQIHHRCVRRKNGSHARKPVWRIQFSSAREILMASRLVLSFLRGSRKQKMEVISEWAERCLQLGHHRGEKYELACEYARKCEETS